MDTIGITLTIRVKVKPTKVMSTQELIDEISSEIDYDIKGTDNVKVISTELMDTTF